MGVQTVGQTLAISGGGVRGIIPALVLERVEEIKSARISALFDEYAGTSTGTLVLSLLMVRDPDHPDKPRFAAKEVVEMFPNYASEIFHETYQQEATSWDGWVSSKYTRNGLVTVGQHVMGDVKFGDLLRDVTFNTARAAAPRFCPEIARISRKTGWSDVSMIDVLSCTTAAPTYFPGMKLTVDGKEAYYLDGGLLENNPIHSAVLRCAEAMGCGAHQLALSLGTGRVERMIAEGVIAAGGVISWATPMVDELFDAQDMMGSEYASCYLKEKGHFLPVQMPISGACDQLDDTTAVNFRRLTEAATDWLAQHDQQLTAFCDELKVRED